jgi:hypothetical protein
MVSTEGPTRTRAGGGKRSGYTITFRVSRLADGRIQAAHKVRLGYHDDLGTQMLDIEYSGRLIGSEAEYTPGPKLEAELRRFVSHEFEMVPRPVTVRVVYEGEGLDPTGRGETSFVVEHYSRPDDDDDDG